MSHKGSSNRLRWGVLSTANIGVEKVVPAMQEGEQCEVVGIASRSGDRAQAVADDLGIPKAYGSYEALLGDPGIEAVYNPLPNHLHVPWSMRAIEAGKHVLCEKPIGLDAAEAEELATAVRVHPELKVMEAFMYRFHPQWRRAKALVDSGAIGSLRTIQSFFAYYNDDPDNIRNAPEMGGGALMDIGCYCISLARFLFGAEPRQVQGSIAEDSRFGVDRLTSGILHFGAGIATFTCATQLAPHQRVSILGTEGRIAIEIPFNAPPSRSCRLWHQAGGPAEEIVVEATNQYTAQCDAFARAVLEDAPVPTPLEDAVANMRVIDAVRQSARDERPVAWQ